MKNTFILILLFGGKSLFSQTIDTIDINDISALIASDGNNFWDGVNSAWYVVPKSDVEGFIPVSSMFATGLWIGGYDDGGDLHIAAQTYRQSGGDFWPGPVADDYAYPGYEEKYDNVWVVDKPEITNHILNWNTAGYVVPEHIAEWPGNGDTANGESSILAPFYDYNANGIYDPENGDYPIIKGDEAVFFMFNDDAADHTETMGEKLKIEVHGMAYAFNVPADSALRKTIFMNYLLINRSEDNYHDLYIGNFADFDIGFFNDDFVGCDSTMNYFFGYNGDYADGPGASYGLNAPAQAVVFLNQQMNCFKLISGSFDVTGYPNATDDFYEYMTGKWQDGTPQTYGGNGYGGIVNSNYMYPSPVFDPAGWSEVIISDVPSDKRGLGSTGPFSFNAGDSICLQMAYVTAFSYDTLYYADTLSTHNCYNATEILRQRVTDIEDYYNAEPGCEILYMRNESYSETNNLSPDHFLIYPQPVDDILHINLSSSDISISICNSLGQIVITNEMLNGENITVDVSSLDPGIYFLTASDLSGIVFSSPLAVK